MDPAKRIVVSLPLEELWTREGPLTAQICRDLSTGEIVGLLRAGPVRFVVADLGQRLKWVAEAESFTFWKSEAKRHIVNVASDGFHLDDFPDQYAYVASERAADLGPPIILLEKHH